MKKVILVLAVMAFLSFHEDVLLSQMAEAGSIIISEIMADPLPVVGLPGEEFLEIMNTTTVAVNLAGWTLRYSGQSAKFPEITIEAGEYLILCSTSDTGTFKPYGRVAGIKSFPPLTDGGRWLAIVDPAGKLVHGIEYSTDWYQDALKKGGGWSLEMIDTRFPFNESSNWRASKSSKGGTPGKVNSVRGENPDLGFEGLLSVFAIDKSTLNVVFSEPVKDLELQLPGIRVNDDPVVSVSSTDLLLRSFNVTASGSFSHSTLSRISFPAALTDFAGNRIKSRVKPFQLTSQITVGELVFNEVLFNPFPGEPDFIEFYNNSSRAFNASELFIASINDENADTSDLLSVSQQNICILPASYFAITTNKNSILMRFPDAVDTSVFEIPQLPSMPDDEGHLLLLDRRLNLIDEMRYNDKMHFSLIAETEGISLEKVQPGLSSLVAGNWKSASELSGWASPGKENSVFTKLTVTDDVVELSAERISPDNNGYEDVLVINLKLQDGGNVVSVRIFDESGSLVRKLAESLYVDSAASLCWDGTSGDGSVLNRGIYIILVSVFNEKGRIQKWKKTCTVIR